MSETGSLVDAEARDLSSLNGFIQECVFKLQQHLISFPSHPDSSKIKALLARSAHLIDERDSKILLREMISMIEELDYQKIN